MGGGLPNLLQYYNRGGGVYWDPKFVLRNKWTAPYVDFWPCPALPCPKNKNPSPSIPAKNCPFSQPLLITTKKQANQKMVLIGH